MNRSCASLIKLLTLLIRWIESMFGSTQVEILDTETTGSPDGIKFICRPCRVAAQLDSVDDHVRSIACPSCGVSLEGDAAVQAVHEQAQYLAISGFQNAIGRGVRGSKAVTFEPSRIKSPSGPFVWGNPKD